MQKRNGWRAERFSPDKFRSGRIQMFAKYITAALAGTALLATVASAQTPPATGERATTPSNAASTVSESSFRGDWRASKVVGLSVYNDSNESLGTINDLLMDKSGNIKAVVLGVGGFLGMGEHLVAVPFDKVKFVDEPVPSTTTTSSGNRPASSTTTGSASTSTTANPWYPNHALFNATKDELKAMPEFKYST
jgi:sporulation protein YlmC with PRC-barrel domain